MKIKDIFVTVLITLTFPLVSSAACVGGCPGKPGPGEDWPRDERLLPYPPVPSSPGEDPDGPNWRQMSSSDSKKILSSGGLPFDYPLPETEKPPVGVAQ